LGLAYSAIWPEDTTGSDVMEVMGGEESLLMMYLLGRSIPPEDSERGRLKGSRSMPDVDVVIVCGGPGVPGVDEDFPLEWELPFLLCFLYLTCKTKNH
jgi:hypothetical protein